MDIVLIGPGRIGVALLPMLEANGHCVTILSRREYGDFFSPVYDPGPAVETITACDAMIVLAGCFELNVAFERMGQANATGPLRVVEALHARFPLAQVITFLDARIRRNQSFISATLEPYLASKRRLARWTLQAAKAWGQTNGTRVNAIAPGPVFPPPSALHREKAGTCLTDRPTVEDIYYGLRFLLETPSVTGQILYIAAGQQLL